MTPFAITVIFILTVLFGLLSLAPIMTSSKDMDSFDHTSTQKTNTAQ